MVWCPVFVLSNGRRGVSNNAMERLHVDSWLANPKNKHRLERFVGVGKLCMAYGILLKLLPRGSCSVQKSMIFHMEHAGI